jgi:hypothetical protein
MQDVLLLIPDAELYTPIPQSEHPAEFSIPKAVWKVPGGQGKQTVSLD